MKKKSLSFLIMILILTGILMSVLNFSIRAYAAPGAIYGTIVSGDTYLVSWWHLNNRYLGRWGGGDWYCVWEERNCCIVFVN